LYDFIPWICGIVPFVISTLQMRDYPAYVLTRNRIRYRGKAVTVFVFDEQIRVLGELPKSQQFDRFEQVL
jgi:hypothetical protein